MGKNSERPLDRPYNDEEAQKIYDAINNEPTNIPEDNTN